MSFKAVYSPSYETVRREWAGEERVSQSAAAPAVRIRQRRGITRADMVAGVCVFIAVAGAAFVAFGL